MSYDKAIHTTNTEILTFDVVEFEETFINSLITGGFTFDILDNLPAPTITKKSKDKRILQSDVWTSESKTNETIFNKIKNLFN